MENPAPLENVTNEPVAHREPLLNRCGRADDDVERKPGANSLPDARSLLDSCSGMRHDDEEIDVRLVPWSTPRMRAEDQDTLRLKQPHDFPDVFFDPSRWNHEDGSVERCMKSCGRS
jgi:hypothetical protein